MAPSSVLGNVELRIWLIVDAAMNFLIFLLLIACGIFWIWQNTTKAGARYLEKEAAEKAAKDRKEWQLTKPERDRAQALKRANDKLRDSDTQPKPYAYQIGQHGNEALAIRYGIANLKLSDITRERSAKIPSDQVVLRKTEKLGADKFRVVLTNHRDREAIAVIEPGTEYVKTFYPLDKAWFDRNEMLETTLKGNGTFNLKELATFHVERAVWG